MAIEFTLNLVSGQNDYATCAGVYKKSVGTLREKLVWVNAPGDRVIFTMEMFRPYLLLNTLLIYMKVLREGFILPRMVQMMSPLQTFLHDTQCNILLILNFENTMDGIYMNSLKTHFC